MNETLLVIICTHHPRKASLDETLAALRAQTLPCAEWNLLVVDNASPAPLAGRLDLTWHPSARIVREEKAGVAHARQRAFLEARRAGAGTILFVDDDNVLTAEYLERGLALGEAWPQIGCWGGQLLPRFETPAPAWMGNFLHYLAVMPLPTDRWTNSVFNYNSVPPTAGCFVRAPVWHRYLELLARDPRRLFLRRAEDMDLALTAIDLGLGLARFRALQLTHLIPSGRLKPAYLTDLVEKTMIDTGLMEYLRFNRMPPPLAPSGIEHVILYWRAWRLPEPFRSLHLAELRGRRAARRTVAAWQRQSPPPAGPEERLQTSTKPA